MEKDGKKMIDKLTEEEREIKRLIEQFNLGGDYWGAIRRLERIGEKAVPALINALEHGSGRMCSGAAYALGEIGEKAVKHEGVIEALIETLKDRNHIVRNNAARALGKMGEKGKKAIEPLRKALKEEKGEEPKFEMALSLARLEGTKKSEGIRVLQKMKEEGELEKMKKSEELNKWEEERLEEFYRKLEIEKKAEEAEKEVQSVNEAAQLLPEVEEKEQLLTIINRLQQTIGELTQEIHQLRAEPRLTAQEFGQYAEEIEKFRGEPSHISVMQQEETRIKEERWWKRWSGEIIASIVGAVIAGGITLLVTWLF
ncbi:MAG: hypothetical protein GF308_08125 [Candidatus Heimdallarchaeota archaeon]|nr:hypothetical protein [Candidatus Heimdallarchaeota archaeon]